MLAILEKIDDLKTDNIAPQTGDTSEAYELNIPTPAQIALDKILQYYTDNAMKPQIELRGTPLDITSGLVRLVKNSLPNDLNIEAKTLLDFMVQEIVQFCREKSARSLSLNFTFERSFMGNI